MKIASNITHEILQFYLDRNKGRFWPVSGIKKPQITVVRIFCNRFIRSKEFLGPVSRKSPGNFLDPKSNI